MESLREEIETGLAELNLCLIHGMYSQAFFKCGHVCGNILRLVLELKGYSNVYATDLVELYETCSRCVYYYNIPMYNYLILPREQWTPERVKGFTSILHQAYAELC